MPAPYSNKFYELEKNRPKTKRFSFNDILFQ